MRRLGRYGKCLAAILCVSHLALRRRNSSRHNTLRTSRKRPCFTRIELSKNSETSAYDYALSLPDDTVDS